MPRKRGVAARSQEQMSYEFYSDIQMEGMLYAELIRTPCDSGKLVSIVPPPLPTGYAILTRDDLPGDNHIDILGTSVPVFCDGSVQYKGEPVGIIVGPDERTVHSLQKQTGVILEQTDKQDGQPHIIATREISAGSAFPEKKDGGECSIIEATWYSSLYVPSHTETNGVICVASGNKINVYTPDKNSLLAIRAISSAVGISKDNIRIKKTRSINNGSSGIWRNSVFASQASLAAIKTRKPVKLSLSRSSQASYMEKPAAVSITIKSCVEKDGTIKALDISINMEAGALNPFAPEIIDRLSIAACGVYGVENTHVSASAFASHCVPATVNMDSIDAQAFFAIENHIQKIAYDMGISPVELRKKNIVCDAEKLNTFPFTFHLGNPAIVLDRAASLSDFNRKYVTYRLDALDRKKSEKTEFMMTHPRGIGMACAFGGAGYFGGSTFYLENYIEVTFGVDKHLVIRMPLVSVTMADIWKKTAADILNIPENNIALEYALHNTELYMGDIYDGIALITELLEECCTEIKEKKDVLSLPVTVKKKITSDKIKQWDKSSFRGAPFYTTSFAAAVVDMELDPATYKECVKGIWLVIDAGEIILAKDAENAVKRDIYGILSHLIEQETIECNNINVYFIQSKGETKRLHGLVQSTLPAAFTSALSLALANTVTSVPLVWENTFIKRMYNDNTADHK